MDLPNFFRNIVVTKKTESSPFLEHNTSDHAETIFIHMLENASNVNLRLFHKIFLCKFLEASTNFVLVKKQTLFGYI